MVRTYTKDKDVVQVYVEENSIREPEVMKELREYTNEKVPKAFMISDVVPIQLIRIFLKLLNAKKCLEIGTFTGYNALNCALTIPDDGKVYALDINEEFVQHGYQFFEKANGKHKIDVKIGPALETMDALLKEHHADTFDFVYVDAHKPEYEEYVNKGHQLLRKGGVIFLDNMLLEERVARLDEEMGEKQKIESVALDKLNRKLKDDMRFDISFLNIDDGVTILYKL